MSELQDLLEKICAGAEKLEGKVISVEADLLIRNALAAVDGAIGAAVASLPAELKAGETAFNLFFKHLGQEADVEFTALGDDVKAAWAHVEASLKTV